MRFSISLLAAFGFLIHTSHVFANPEDGRPAKIPTFDETGVQPGDQVDSLQLQKLDSKQVDLALSWRDRPVLLVLSSISCPVSRDNCAAVDRIAKKFAGQIHVVVIYTIEAHPVDAVSPYSDRPWLTERNARDRVLVKEPKKIDERIQLAKDYRELKSIKATMVVDAMDDRAWKHIGPGPNTAVFVDNGGQVIKRQGWLDTAVMESSIRWTLLDASNKVLVAKANALSKKLGFDAFRSLNYMGQEEYRDKADRVLREAPELVNLMFGSGRGDTRGDTLLHEAAEYGNAKKVDYLLQFMPSRNAINQNGRTPLYLAAARGHEKVVTTLLSHGGDPNAFDNQGLSPTHAALLAGHDSTVRNLIDAGGAMDIRIAAGIGDLAALKRYIDVYRATEIYLKMRGGAALSFAAANNQTQAIELLLDAGVIQSKEVDGQLAFYYAVHNQQHAAVELLLEKKVKSDVTMDTYLGSPLHFAAYKKDDALINLLLKHGADVEELNLDEESPLHLAAQVGGAEAVSALLDAGAKIDARTGKEAPRPCGPPGEDNRSRLDTPLHLAAHRGHHEVVAMLLNRGASPSLKNRNGQTPLNCAEEAHQSFPRKETNEVVRLLKAKAGGQ